MVWGSGFRGLGYRVLPYCGCGIRDPIHKKGVAFEVLPRKPKPYSTKSTTKQSVEAG